MEVGMARRALVLAGALAVIGAISPVSAQDLQDYTPEQRWARAERLLNSWVVFGIRHGKMMGQSLEQTAGAMVEVYGPGWSQDMGPLDMLRSLHRNWMWQRGAEFEVLEASEDEVRFRANRAYVASYFGDDMQAYGVTVEEYEKLLELFQSKICEQRGMVYESRVDGDWLEVVVRSR